MAISKATPADILIILDLGDMLIPLELKLF